MAEINAKGDQYNDKVWYYKDKFGEKGPFNRLKMTELYLDGALSDNVSVRHDNHEYMLLTEWFSGGSTAFLMFIPKKWTLGKSHIYGRYGYTDRLANDTIRWRNPMSFEKSDKLLMNRIQTKHLLLYVIIGRIDYIFQRT